MIYTSYTKTDAYYEFVGDEGKLIMPATDVVLVNDDSGMLAIKNTASRCTVGLLKIAPPAPSPKWIATYTGGTTSSAECDSTSAISRNEISKSGIVSVEIKDCVTTIGERAFDGYTSLTSCTIGNGVTTISDKAFYDCSGLTSINIPNSVTSIGNSAFYRCSGLTSIVIPDSVTTIGSGAVWNCSSITSVNIPSGVTTIGRNTFNGCNSLTSITIPNGVTSIGRESFEFCWNLTNIDIPDSVTSIDYQAFRNCSGLTSITIEATDPPTLGTNVFQNTNDCTIYVPAESVDTYKATSGWSTYASRIQAIQ